MSADGVWKITINTPMGAQEVTATLVTSGNTFTGATKGPMGDQTISGAVDGDTLTWSAQISQPMPMTLEFDAKVAARDHHRVGQLEDLVQPLDRLRLLDLGQQGRLVVDQRPCLCDVLRPLDEGQGDIIGALVQREGKILSVLLGQRRDRDQHARDIDALVVADLAADFHHRGDPVLFDADHPKPHLAVVDQQAGVLFDRLEQLGMGQFGPGLVAQPLVAVEDEHMAGGQFGGATVKLSNAQLGSLQVEQDRRRPMEFLLQRANVIDQFRLLLLVAVAHVDAKGVRAGEHQLANGLGVAGGGAERREDFDLARTGSEGVGHRLAHSRLI